MKNEPVIEVKGSIDAITYYKNPDGMWIITDHNTGVTTQGESKYDALLMLADALAGHDSADIDLAEQAEDIFTVDSEIGEELG